MPVPITLIRAHLNLDHDHDDELLTHYTDAAEAWVAAYTGQPFSRHSLETQAVLMLVAHSYENREAVSFANPFSLPFGVHDVLSPLKARITGHQAEVTA
ncbi:head-tail connector protein [Paracoccus salipaludis]|uniref:Phage gp6-like head-tail connector protein n=1 Tax=Paracoccus salipaludis TaxID=2032623 RepID=A0A2A2GQ23_9RHOB|nr:head-tail connector protein [Paracoccus salipaludis]PAU98962.1 hypothetical protein CK240_02210 [Paracoccus salipaludis]